MTQLASGSGAAGIGGGCGGGGGGGAAVSDDAQWPPPPLSPRSARSPRSPDAPRKRRRLNDGAAVRVAATANAGAPSDASQGGNWNPLRDGGAPEGPAVKLLGAVGRREKGARPSSWARRAAARQRQAALLEASGGVCSVGRGVTVHAVVAVYVLWVGAVVVG